MAARARCQVDRPFSAAIDCRPLRFPYSTRRCGGEGTQEPEPPIAPVQSFSRLFKVVQSLKSVPSKSVQTFHISLRRRLRNTAFRRISSNNPERGCAMRLCPDDDLTGPTGRGHRLRRSHARQAQTLRFFWRLRLLRPPPSSKPQRLLAATGPEPTLAADSVLGARQQLPDVVSMNGPLTHNHPRPRCEYRRARQQLHLPATPPPKSSTALRQQRFYEAR
jgi:hypothetical protein